MPKISEDILFGKNLSDEILNACLTESEIFLFISYYRKSYSMQKLGQITNVTSSQIGHKLKDITRKIKLFIYDIGFNPVESEFNKNINAALDIRLRNKLNNTLRKQIEVGNKSIDKYKTSRLIWGCPICGKQRSIVLNRRKHFGYTFYCTKCSFKCFHKYLPSINFSIKMLNMKYIVIEMLSATVLSVLENKEAYFIDNFNIRYFPIHIDKEKKFLDQSSYD